MIPSISIVLLNAVVLTGAASADPSVKVLDAWTPGPFEVRVAFDRAVDPKLVESVVGLTIEFKGTDPKGKSQGSLKTTAAKLLDDGATLSLTTDPHPRGGIYSFILPNVRAAGFDAPTGDDIPVTYSPEGFEAAWESDVPNEQPAARTGWLPGTALADYRPEVAKTSAFQEVLRALSKTGKMTLTSLVRFPEGEMTVRVTSDVQVEATLNGEEPVAGANGLEFRLESVGDPAFLSLSVPTGPKIELPSVSITYETAGKKESLDRSRTLLPWVPSLPAPSNQAVEPPKLEGGDASRGKLVFEGAAGKCSVCHRVQGKGGLVGPDLSKLEGTDPYAVYRDIAEPSARINPDYVGYTIALKDGTVRVGTVRSLGSDKIEVRDGEGKTSTIDRDEMEEFRPSATSIMPVGLAGALGEEKLRDLICYLTKSAWQTCTTDVSSKFRGVSKAENGPILASGTAGTLLSSVDLGRTWTKLVVPGTEALDFRDVEALDDRTIILMSAGVGESSRIYKSTDQGRTWTLSFKQDDPHGFLDAVSFFNPKQGLVMGDPIDGRFQIHRTEDAGKSWQPIESLAMPEALENEGGFAASGTCLVARPDGHAWFATGGAAVSRVFRSRDFGRTWAVAETPIPADSRSKGIFGLSFLDENEGFAIGGDYKAVDASGPHLAKTEDGGKTWKSIENGPPGFREAIAFIDGVLIAVGPSGNDVSMDRGKTWAPLGSSGFHSVKGFLQESKGWFVGVGDNGRIGLRPAGDIP